MTKLTLSVPAVLIQDAKQLARQRKTTVSDLFGEGLARLREPDLRTISALTFRAWHHFQDATPFIPLAIVAFRDLGFRVDPLRTGFRLSKNGRKYVVQHKKRPEGMLIRVHRWGQTSIIAELNMSALAKRLERTNLVSDYLAIVREIQGHAALVAADADTL